MKLAADVAGGWAPMPLGMVLELLRAKLAIFRYCVQDGVKVFGTLLTSVENCGFTNCEPRARVLPDVLY